MLAYLLHGVTLMLAWFLTVNAIASGIVAVVIGRLATDAASRIPTRWPACGERWKTRS